MLSKLLCEFKPINLKEMRPDGFTARRDWEIKQCIENVTNGKGWRNVDVCPICNSSNRDLVFSKFGIDIFQCSECRAGYVGKFPVDTVDVYSGNGYLDMQKHDYLDNVEYRKNRFGKERLEIIRKYLGKSHDGITLLDIGCGTGWFLECAKEAGYEVSGQDLCSELSVFTANKLGIRIWNESIVTLPKSECYDVITLFDVIEHVPNPKEVAMSIKEHLNIGGISLIFTPNFDSFGFQNIRENLSLVTPAEHILYFTKMSITRLFEDVGLKVLYFETKGTDILDLYAYYRETLRKNEVADFLAENADVMQAIIDESGCANHMRVVLKKT